MQKMFTAVITLSALALMMGPTSAVASSEIATAPVKTWVFTQNCDAVGVLQESQSPYPIPNSEVVCFPKSSIMNIEENVGLLRSVFPSDIFIFTYDTNNPQTARDLRLFLLANDNNRAPAGAAGKAFIEDGYAVASSAGLIIQHEYAHVSTCSVAHNQFGEPDTTKKIIEAEWC